MHVFRKLIKGWSFDKVLKEDFYSKSYNSDYFEIYIKQKTEESKLASSK